MTKCFRWFSDVHVGAAAAVALLLTVAPLTASPSDPPARRTTDTYEVIDAPVRSVLELLVRANDGEDSLVHGEGGADERITLKTSTVWLEGGLQAVMRSSRLPLTFTTTKKDTPLPTIPTIALVPSRTVPYKSERDVPRRVCAVLHHDVYLANGKKPVVTWFAVIESDTPGQTVTQTTQVVDIGTSVVTPLQNAEPLHVVGITTRGVMLQPQGGKSFAVPLAPLVKP